ncbi:hypothetical protein [Amphritea sp. HPY]|uniref:hypothetical protein n=1 Tax=Amphritea sp. HPY TaxID=3421652 RepID=UPI003D7D45D5
MIWRTIAEFKFYLRHRPDVPIATLADWALDTAPLYYRHNRIAFLIHVKRNYS